MRKQIAAANWKMNLSLTEAGQLVDDLLKGMQPLSKDQVSLLAVPYPYLLMVQEKIKGVQNLEVAAQNCSAFKNGAYTGEVSAAMLQGMSIEYVILGHSERREYQKESNAELATKLDISLAHGIKPIFCCGEPIGVREDGTQNNYVATQLKDSLFHLDSKQMDGFIIAYEPIWAIGTGLTATSSQAEEMHAHIRKVIADEYGGSTADTISILYGGSVKASNAMEIFSQPNVDGGLVGGASLVATEFAAIMNSLKKP